MTHRLKTTPLKDDRGVFHQEDLDFCFSTPGSTTESRDKASMEKLSSQWKKKLEMEPQEDEEKSLILPSLKKSSEFRAHCQVRYLLLCLILRT